MIPQAKIILPVNHSSVHQDLQGKAHDLFLPCSSFQKWKVHDHVIMILPASDR